MATPLLETKLYVPRSRRATVPRPRLTERLTDGLGGHSQPRLTLLSAPAGFGKTTLLGEIAADPTSQRAVAWFSIDRLDDEASVFWAYLIEAVDRAVPGVSAPARDQLSTGSTRVEAVLATLINDVHARGEDFLLILDDYHLIEDPAIQSDMAFLVEHLPPQVHLLLGARADPALPLARLRATGRLAEIRAADLRFSAEEATEYLNGSLGLELDDDAVAALEARTEGWIAALQLAGLSLQDRPDAASFIQGFAGDDRFVVDYLAEEVLQRQPDEVRRFLLQTSILERLTGPLCDAVTDSDGFLATLSESLGPDAARVFRGYVDQPGVPRVSASLQCKPGTAPKLTLSQERYLPAGSTGNPAAPQAARADRVPGIPSLPRRPARRPPRGQS